jgi:hypothetical protein
MPGLTPHITAQLTVMAGRGFSVEQMASRLGLSPAAVEAELRWLRLTAGKAPEQGSRDYYAVEVEIGAGGWLQRRQRFGRLADAQLQVEEFRRRRGGARGPGRRGRDAQGHRLGSRPHARGITTHCG